MKKYIVVPLLMLVAFMATAQRRSHHSSPNTYSNSSTQVQTPTRSQPIAHPYYGGGQHTESHGGHYEGGNSGSSHKGGHYVNDKTYNTYGRHK